MIPSIISDDKIADMVEAAKAAPSGCFVEIGVYKGGSASYLYEIAETRGQKLHLFDTFTGIPYQGELDPTAVGEFSDTDVEVIKAALPNAVFHFGLFPDTVPTDLRDIAFIHFDADQYQSLKGIKTHLWDRMVPGGIVFMDDYGIMEGLRKAIAEDYATPPIATKSGQYYLVK